MLRYLRAMQEKGHMVCAWNGLGFDLRWLGHVAEDPKLAATVAMNLYDRCFNSLISGVPLGSPLWARP